SIAISSAMNTTAEAVVITAPAIASGWRTSASSRLTGVLLEARQVCHQRVEVGGGQRRVLVRHRWFLGRLGLRGHLRRVGNPLADLVGAQLRADSIQRIGLVAFSGNRVAQLTFLRGVDLGSLLGILSSCRPRDHDSCSEY